MEYALAFEGGGAKGAYQVGAWKALTEMGYKFNAVIGTSIGAINAAFIAQGDFKALEKLWKTLRFGDLMDIDTEIMENLIETKKIHRSTISEINRATKSALKTRGIDINLMREIMETYLDEDKIRKSDIRFGLVTFNVSDFKPEKLFIEDIPEGKLVEYLLASSNLPVFKRQKIDEKSFLDGGAFDNCSVEMLYDAGYRNIMASRLRRKNNRIRNYSSLKKKKDINLKMLIPSVELPYILNFESKTLNNMIEYGYIDTLKQLKRLEGSYYTINRYNKDELDGLKEKFNPVASLNICKACDVKYVPGDNIMDICIRKAIPKLSKEAFGVVSTKFGKELVTIVEYVARREKIVANKVYNLDELIKATKEKIVDINLEKIKGIDKAMYMVVQAI